MVALGNRDGANRDGARPLPPPAGIERRRVAFADGMEQPREEYFLAGTAQTLVAGAPATARRPRITNPVTGSVYALDPDIPVQNQRLAIGVSGEVAAHRLLLDNRDLGAADAHPLVLAGPGRHRLRLVDIAGRVVDQVVFTMR
jgi:penicillin-binding protein 1C